jgi:glycerol kinase
VVDAMNADSDVALRRLRVDGGMTANGLLMQFLADVLDVPVVRSRITETTCLGAAYAAGLAVGFWPDLATLRGQWRSDAQWESTMETAHRERELRNWRKAVQRTLDWVDDDDDDFTS